MRKSRLIALSIALATILFTGGYVYALTTLGSQNLPSFAVQVQNPFVFCQNLAPGQSVTPNFIVYTCSSPADAFQVTFNANPVPTFDLTNSGFDQLWLHQNSTPSFTGTDGCGPASSSIFELTSGTPVAVTPGYYEYCAHFSGPQSFTPVAVSWSI